MRQHIIQIGAVTTLATSRCRWFCFPRRWRFSSAILVCLFLTLTYILYEVQYKTGIEILPFLPIDDSGFELYNETILQKTEVSDAAKYQSTFGSLLCWVMTTSVYHKTRVRAVNGTWLRRCDASHFLTNSGRFLNNFTPYHTIFSSLPDSYFKLFWKTRLALYYVYKNISSHYDWYFKADDDTYVVVENLKAYLSRFDPSEPHFIGFRVKRRMPMHGYNAGGSGYAMSRAAMKVFAEQLFHMKSLCPYHEWEDLAVARCLASMGIYPTDTRDELHRQRFLPWTPEQHYQGDLTRHFLMDPIEHWGPAIFHENLISMHHLGPEEIRLIDGLLYGVAAGIWNRTVESVEETLGPPHGLRFMKRSTNSNHRLH